jgi:hypothetical protein
VRTCTVYAPRASEKSAAIRGQVEASVPVGHEVAPDADLDDRRIRLVADCADEHALGGARQRRGRVGERSPPGVMRERPATMVPWPSRTRVRPRRKSTPLSIQLDARPTSTVRDEKRASSSERPSISNALDLVRTKELHLALFGGVPGRGRRGRPVAGRDAHGEAARR